ncbi:hypothetical protein B0O80DRAFT_462717 [Mortierella sp. GBAus27b]|nr:hypothetical protein B0O80DRAFT_462717 [Mortierella sp. GBAus27b]
MTRLGLILTVSLAAAAAVVTGVSTSTADDPCALLGRDKSKATFEFVNGCYQNIPFNEDVAKKTLDIISLLYHDFYIFRDAALYPNLQAPFTSPPVDLIKEFDRIRSTKYPNDFLFHTDISKTINLLNDAHTAYRPRCYTAFLFTQAIHLYAPVIDGKQSIRVFDDLSNRPYQDCEVVTIDGEPALAHVKAYAENLGGYSKDAGVRLNQVLSSKLYNATSGEYVLNAGTYAERINLPYRPYVDYELSCPQSEDTHSFADDIGSSFLDPAAARLSQAFGSNATAMGDFALSTGRFADQTVLSNKNFDYERNCPASATTIKIREPWIILDLSRTTFSDTQSYIQNVCAADPAPSSPKPTPSSKVNGGNYGILLADGDDPSWEGYVLLPRPEKSALLERLERRRRRRAPGFPMPTPTPAPGPPAEPDAVVVAHGNGTVFYLLKDKPDVGVASVFSHGVQDSEINVFLEAFEIFHQHNVTKILIDLQANSGGYVSFAAQLVQVFFPNGSAFDTSLPSDLRVTESIQELSNAGFGIYDVDLYDASSYLDWKSKSKYTSNLLFDEFRALDRGGRDADYSQLATLEPSYMPKHPQLANYPWTNKATQITILTDGRCGSACGLSIHYFHQHHGVRAIAVGGYQSHALSMFSFVGGAVTNLPNILGYYEAAGVPSPVTTLPYKAIFALPVLEVHANDSPIPLEYDYPLYPANAHIDFDSSNSRYREALWNQVAGLAWA